MWDLKYHTKELIHKRETGPETQKTDLWPGVGGRDGLAVWG